MKLFSGIFVRFFKNCINVRSNLNNANVFYIQSILKSRGKKHKRPVIGRNISHESLKKKMINERLKKNDYSALFFGCVYISISCFYDKKIKSHMIFCLDFFRKFSSSGNNPVEVMLDFFDLTHLNKSFRIKSESNFLGLPIRLFH